MPICSLTSAHHVLYCRHRLRLYTQKTLHFCSSSKLRVISSDSEGHLVKQLNYSQSTDIQSSDYIPMSLCVAAHWTCSGRFIRVIKSRYDTRTICIFIIFMQMYYFHISCVSCLEYYSSFFHSNSLINLNNFIQAIKTAKVKSLLCRI